MELVAPVLDAPPLKRYGLPEYMIAESPAAGSHFVQTIEGRWLVRLLSVAVRLNTDATAASRTLRLEYRDDADVVYDVMGNPVTYPAGTVNEDYFFSPFQGRGEWEVATANLVPLHPLLLLPTHDFRIFVNNIQAGDTLTRIRFTWERFYPPTPPPGLPA